MELIRKMPTSIVLVTNIGTRPLLASVTLILVVRDILTWGDILLMPAVGDVKLNPGRADYPEEGYRSRFDHATEKSLFPDIMK